MSLPKYDELYRPILAAIEDGSEYHVKDAREKVASTLHISAPDLEEMLPSGRITRYADRFGWAKTYLRKAGLVSSPRRGYISITDEGKQVLENNDLISNEMLADRFPNFASFIRHSGAEIQEGVSAAELTDTNTPQEVLEDAYKAIQKQLAEDLLTEIMNQSPTFFEKMVVELMEAMGYGEGTVTQASGDGGIDGIINGDKLGFDQIYLQAKRWDLSTSIGKPELQKFAGAMMGPPKIEKGLFITTAKFSQGAREYAKVQHIILVDGERLAELMIEYNLGVSVQTKYELKRIDTDYFTDLR